MTSGHETISHIANTATYGGSGAAIFFGLTANEFAALAGVVIALIGLIVSIYFKWLERKDRQEHYTKLLERGNE